MALLFVFVVKINSFIKCLIILPTLIFWPSILGFFCTILGFSFEIPSFLLEDGKSYYITPFLTVSRKMYETRAFSYFWEPGLLAFVMNIIIAIKLFGLGFKPKECLRECILIVLSQSVGGVVSLALLFTSYLLSNIKALDKIVGTFLIIIISLFYFDFHVFFESMILLINSITIPLFDRNMLYDASFASRIFDFYYPFVAAFDNPFFGNVDLEQYSDLSKIVRGHSERIITNSWASIAYYYGYLFLCLFVFLFLSAITYMTKRKSITMWIWFFVLFSSSPVYLTIFIWVFCFYFVFFQDDYFHTSKTSL